METRRPMEYAILEAVEEQEGREGARKGQMGWWNLPPWHLDGN